MKKVIFYHVVLLLAILLAAVPVGQVMAAVQSNEPYPVEEVPEKRTRNSDTYLLSDGSYECVVYSDDKYYTDEDGVFALIDNSIVDRPISIDGEQYAYANAANSSHYYFSGTSPKTVVDSGKEHISFAMLTEGPSVAVIGGNKDLPVLSDHSLCGDNFIMYPGVCRDTDVVYSARNGMLKEYIVLNCSDAPNAFSFEIGINSLELSESKDGTLSFLNAEGEPVFELADLFAVDAAGEYTDRVEYSVEESADGSIILTVTLSEEYFNSPERAFPILIDPSTVLYGSSSTYDTYVSSKKPAENFYTAEQLRMGWDTTYNVRRTYIKFDLPQNIPGNSITLAYMSLKKDSCGNTPSLKAYRVTSNWTSSTLTWNNKPGHTSTYASATATEMTNDWFRFYVTDIVKLWRTGTNPNYGFMVKNSNESDLGNWSTFLSSDVSTGKPQLRITYKEVNNHYYNYYRSVIDHNMYMKPVALAVQSAMNDYGYYGSELYWDYDNNVMVGSISKSGLTTQLQNKTVFSCISHGYADHFELLNSESYTIDDVEALASTNLDLVVLGCCHCGFGGEQYDNIVNAFYNKGILTVIGFKHDLGIGHGNLWVQTFMTNIAAGQTVGGAITAADTTVKLQYDIDDDDFPTSDVGMKLIRGSTIQIPCP